MNRKYGIDNYKNGFEAAKQIKIPTLSILATDDKMCPVKEGKKLANLIDLQDPVRTGVIFKEIFDKPKSLRGRVR